MPVVHDRELQARLLAEVIEVNERKRKLEATLGAADARHQLLVESAARKDIETYTRVATAVIMSTPRNFKERPENNESGEERRVQVPTM